MTVTEETRLMKEALKENVIPYLRENGFRGSMSNFHRTCGERTDLISFYFNKIGNMAFTILAAPVFPGRLPLQKGANLSDIHYDPNEPLHVRSAWLIGKLPGYLDERIGKFYYGHVYRYKHFFHDGRYRPQYSSFTEKGLQYAPWLEKDEKWVKLYWPDSSSCNLIAKEALRQMEEMMQQLNHTESVRDWEEYCLTETLKSAFLHDWRPIEKTVDEWKEHNAADIELIDRVYEQWKQTEYNKKLGEKQT